MVKLRRWFVWRFKCRGGRDCADTSFGPLEVHEGEVPVGAVFVIEFECDRCHTKYQNEAFVAEGGELIQSGRMRR